MKHASCCVCSSPMPACLLPRATCIRACPTSCKTSACSIHTSMMAVSPSSCCLSACLPCATCYLHPSLPYFLQDFGMHDTCMMAVSLSSCCLPVCCLSAAYLLPFCCEASACPMSADVSCLPASFLPACLPCATCRLHPSPPYFLQDFSMHDTCMMAAAICPSSCLQPCIPFFLTAHCMSVCLLPSFCLVCTHILKSHL